MSYKVCYSDRDVTTKAGFGKVAHLPFLMDNRPGYHRLGSRYLIDRGLGYWNPATRGRGPRAGKPTKKTIRNYAYWLANFLEWVEARCLTVERCDYADHVQDGYQLDMLEGRWSANGRPLEPSTVNARVQQACDFLTWLGDKGGRTPFEVPTETVEIKVGSARSSVGHRTMEVTRRVGKVRQNKRKLRMPSHAQVREWLADVKTRHGEMFALVCESILLTALRIEETVALRMDTLPDEPSEWHVTNADAPEDKQEVLVDIKFGAKGPDYAEDHGDKTGPERTILVPLTLAKKWHAYRNRYRNDALKKLVDGAATPKEKKERIAGAVHLFLHEGTGKRLTADNVYRAWTQAKQPYKGWSPHLGRDWWACSTLLGEMEKLEHLKTMGPGVAAQLIEATAVSVIRLRIQPQLGHTSESTTLIYLQWVMDYFGVPLSIHYDDAFEDDSHD